MAGANHIQLLQASADQETVSEFRILVDRHIKYVTIDPAIYDEMDLIFEPSLKEILGSILPEGDWTHAHISLDSLKKEDRATKVEVSKQKLPGISKIWHSVKVDYLDLKIGKRLRSNVYEAKHPDFPHLIVVKFARFAWEISWLEAETAAYKWIDGHGIGPAFLGHLTEHGRVIGFMMSRVENARHATPQDLEQCREALKRLHALKIKHGDTNKHNFLIHAQGTTLIDFDFAEQNADAAGLAEELRGLEEDFKDMSGRGGVGVAI